MDLSNIDENLKIIVSNHKEIWLRCNNVQKITKPFHNKLFILSVNAETFKLHFKDIDGRIFSAIDIFKIVHGSTIEEYEKLIDGLMYLIFDIYYSGSNLYTSEIIEKLKYRYGKQIILRNFPKPIDISDYSNHERLYAVSQKWLNNLGFLIG